MDDPRGRQFGFNAASRNQWNAFTEHRQRVTTLLGGGGAPRPTRLCVLGAGNANDLDLLALLTAHREVHLVDLDAEALAQAAARQGVSGHPGLKLFGGLDLTGMLDCVATWSPQTHISPADLQALAEWPALRVRLALPGPYDVVASTCLLSQLIANVFPPLGDSHSQFRTVARAIRAGHLRLLAQLALPGGTAVLITDVVSSDTYPPLPSVPEEELSGLLRRLTRDGNFIHGIRPEKLLSELRRDPVLSARVAQWKVESPWRWQLHARVYLVWAVALQTALRV